MRLPEFRKMALKILTGLVAIFIASAGSGGPEAPPGGSESHAGSESAPALAGSPGSEALIRIGNKTVSASHLAVLLARDAGPAKIAELTDNFVGERLVYEYGEDNGITASEEEINNFIDEGIGGELYRLLTQLFGEEVVRDLIRQRLIVEKVVEQKKQDFIAKNNISVTDKEVQDYYLAHLKEMIKPEAVRFQYLVLQEEKKAQEALAALRKDGKIEDLWKKYSMESNYDTEEPVPKPELVKVFGTAFVDQLLKLPLNEWTRLNLGRFIFIVRVLEKSPPVEPKLEDVKSDIKNLLLQKKIAPLMRDWFKEVRAMYPVTTDVPFFRSVLFGEEGIEFPGAESEPEEEAKSEKPAPPASPRAK
jgi:hypothetical protein